MNNIVFLDGEWSEDFTRLGEKKRRLNPVGENVYLLPDGSIKREEDLIIKVQRIWRERAYAPPGTLFERRGVMYRKTLESFIKQANPV